MSNFDLKSDKDKQEETFAAMEVYSSLMKQSSDDKWLEDWKKHYRKSGLADKINEDLPSKEAAFEDEHITVCVDCKKTECGCKDKTAAIPAMSAWKAMKATGRSGAGVGAGVGALSGAVGKVDEGESRIGNVARRALGGAAVGGALGAGVGRAAAKHHNKFRNTPAYAGKFRQIMADAPDDKVQRINSLLRSDPIKTAGLPRYLKNMLKSRKGGVPEIVDYPKSRAMSRKLTAHQDGKLFAHKGSKDPEYLESVRSYLKDPNKLKTTKHASLKGVVLPTKADSSVETVSGGELSAIGVGEKSANARMRAAAVAIREAQEHSGRHILRSSLRGAATGAIPGSVIGYAGASEGEEGKGALRGAGLGAWAGGGLGALGGINRVNAMKNLAKKRDTMRRARSTMEEADGARDLGIDPRTVINVKTASMPGALRKALVSAGGWGSAGALHGALTADKGERLRGALRGGALGAAAGSVAPAGEAGVKKLLKMATPYDDTPLFDPLQRAAEKYPTEVSTKDVVKETADGLWKHLAKKYKDYKQTRTKVVESVTPGVPKEAGAIKEVAQHVFGKLTPEQVGSGLMGAAILGTGAYMASKPKDSLGGKSRAEVSAQKTVANQKDDGDSLLRGVYNRQNEFTSGVATELRKKPHAAAVLGAMTGAALGSRFAKILGAGR